MVIKKCKLECPICEGLIRSSQMLSCFVFGLQTDLAKKGLCVSYPNVHSCSHCNYVYIDKTLNVDKTKVKKLLSTPSYQELFMKYSNSDEDDFNKFKIIYEIYQYLEIDIYQQHLILLYSYYNGDSLKNFKYFINEIEKELPLYNNHLLKGYPIDFYRGEYYRRIGAFNQAKELFEKLIKKEKENQAYLKIANFQLQLIEQKDQTCRTIET